MPASSLWCRSDFAMSWRSNQKKKNKHQNSLLVAYCIGSYGTTRLYRFCCSALMRMSCIVLEDFLLRIPSVDDERLSLSEICCLFPPRSVRVILSDICERGCGY